MGQMTQHVYTSPGGYAARLIVSNGTNSATVTRPIIAMSSGTTPAGSVVASFSATPLSGVAPLTVQFDAGDSTPSDGSLMFTWDFDDGTIGDGASVQHTFTSAGTYVVRLTAANDDGSAFTTRTVTVTAPPVNRAPIAVIASGPRTGVAPVSLTFDGNLSRDPDNDPLTFLWEVRLNGEVVQSNDTGARVALTFADPGIYSVTLTVTDSLDASNTSNPETVTIRARSTDGSNDNGSGQPIPTTPRARRSTGFCGLGFVGMAALALGLAAMSVVHRRRR
jgi:PKD repeat protein